MGSLDVFYSTAAQNPARHFSRNVSRNKTIIVDKKKNWFWFCQTRLEKVIRMLTATFRLQTFSSTELFSGGAGS